MVLIKPYQLRNPKAFLVLLARVYVCFESCARKLGNSRFQSGIQRSWSTNLPRRYAIIKPVIPIQDVRAPAVHYVHVGIINIYIYIHIHACTCMDRECEYKYIHIKLGFTYLNNVNGKKYRKKFVYLIVLLCIIKLVYSNMYRLRRFNQFVYIRWCTQTIYPSIDRRRASSLAKWDGIRHVGIIHKHKSFLTNKIK